MLEKTIAAAFAALTEEERGSILNGSLGKGRGVSHSIVNWIQGLKKAGKVVFPKGFSTYLHNARLPELLDLVWKGESIPTRFDPRWNRTAAQWAANDLVVAATERKGMRVGNPKKANAARIAAQTAAAVVAVQTGATASDQPQAQKTAYAPIQGFVALATPPRAFTPIKMEITVGRDGKWVARKQSESLKMGVVPASVKRRRGKGKGKGKPESSRKYLFTVNLPAALAHRN